MSYSVYTVTDGAGIDAAIDALVISYDHLPEADAQLAAAKEAAKAIVKSGTVGDPASVIFQVSISGHANPNHAPASGYANDAANVSVSQTNQAALEAYQASLVTAEDNAS